MTEPSDATDAPTPDGRHPASPRRRRRRRKSASAREPRRPPVQREISAGGVLYLRHDGRVEVMLASRRTLRGEIAWGLAKGGIEDGESLEDAAVREVLDETGYVAEIEASLGDTRYFYFCEYTPPPTAVLHLALGAQSGRVGDSCGEQAVCAAVLLPHPPAASSEAP